jgi:hypothetical protein
MFAYLRTVSLKFAVNILQLTTSSKGYILFMFSHHAHVWERACVSARVVTHSNIFGRILFKFDGHILQMTTSYTACTRVRACVCERASIQQTPRGYMSHIICVWMHVLTARTSIYSRICQARDGQWLVVLKWQNIKIQFLVQWFQTQIKLIIIVKSSRYYIFETLLIWSNRYLAWFKLN